MNRTEIQSCEEALRLLAAHIDGELEPPTEKGLEDHLARCRSCYSRAEFERRLKEQVSALASEEVSPSLTRRVKSLIGQFDGSRTTDT